MNMSVRKTLLIIVVFLTILTAFRFVWFQIFAVSNTPKAVHGVLDLRDWDELSDHSVSLAGEWEFYPHMFLINEQDRALSQQEKEMIQVPGSWGFSEKKENAYGYGTYRLRILLNSQNKDHYALHIPRINSSFEVFINGELAVQAGKIGKDKKEYEPSSKQHTVQFTVEGEEIELVIHAANYDHLLDGGIISTPKFGFVENIEKGLDISLFVILAACVVYLFHSLYSFIIFWLGRKLNYDRRLLYFSWVGILVILATLMSERLLYEWLPLDFAWSIKGPNLGLIAGGYVVLQLIKQQLPKALFRWSKYYAAFMAALALLTLILPVPHNTVLTSIITFITLIPCLLGIVIMYRFVLPINQDNIFLFLGMVASVYSFVWLIVIEIMHIDIISYPFDLLITIICFAVYFFKQYFLTLSNTEKVMLELQEADKRKDNFLVSVAHEIKNPLHSMLNIAQTVLAREKDKLEDTSVRDLELSVKVTRRMAVLLNDLLDLERMKEKPITLQMQEVSVHSVAESIVDMLRFMAEGKKIQLVNRIPADFPKVIADENRLNQILFNLLHNAVKFSHNGEVFVLAVIEDDKAKISVKDEGVGIAEEFLAHVFEPYKQDDSVNVMNESGIGVGLSICKQLVELHGGKLEVHSKVNEGSVFTFTLQLSSANNEEEQLVQEIVTNAGFAGIKQVSAAAEAEEIKEQVNMVEKQNTTIHDDELVRIMAVDDDPVNLIVLESIFSTNHIEVHTVTNGEDALLLLDKGKWDLLIIDVMMPHMSGYELTAHIREKYSISELPILLLTAYNREEAVEAGFHAGANDYVAKPMNAIELVSRARALVKLKRSFSERLRMEAAWLQAQIKPHFMINTFNSIVALSRIDLERMDALIDELSNYIRLSIDFQNSDGTAPLERELDLVRSYLFIQKERFHDRIQVVWDIDGHVQIDIPPLTIQPLVENAISHGILKQASGGEIRIRIKEEEEHIVISVSDNGVGMSEKTMSGIMKRRADKHRGIGLRNTNRRLKQRYDRGLEIHSQLGVGTTVSFKIPKQTISEREKVHIMLE